VAVSPRRGQHPAYRQIADDLRAAIASGRYQVGDQLPAERELARQYGVAAMTVRHGLEVLRGEGVVVSTEKRGHFVARLPGPGDDPGRSPEYEAFMEQLRAMREDLRQVHQRLDRLEELAAPETRGDR
jgi:DNA-binding GntR family transcriptional regulator